MNIVFLDAETLGKVPNLDILEPFGEVTYYQKTNPAQTHKRIKKADIVITNKVVLDRQIIEQADNLKLICVAATGTDNIDKTAAREQGIPVKNAKDYASQSVAQTTFAILLHHLQSISYYDNYIKQGEYSQNDIFTHHGNPFSELSGKCFGIIGLGNIGSQVAKIADAFGSKVVYYSTTGKNTEQPYPRFELEEFLKTSDIVSIHAPLNENTYNLIDLECFRIMKKSAILLNLGRGEIVNEDDLAFALDNGLISAAGLDVFKEEPIDAENPLLKIKNTDKLVMTPHIAWASIEARTLLMEKIKQNIEEFLKEGK
jgi:glycerate dehydrogenase